jgi:glycine/D-amino acid oxidase-like deaminating enzyme
MDGMRVEFSTLPVAVIGAGPVGLAAAAQLLRAGDTPLVLEAGATAGASVLEWGHVRLFSPWRYNVDAAARELLLASGWQAPAPDRHPTGRELVEQYLAPLAALPKVAPHIRYGARVTAVTRKGLDKLKTAGRAEAPFTLRVTHAYGSEEQCEARAVIDASGTWTRPNPLGSDGVPAIGELANAERVCYGVPDVLGRERARYAGRRVLVVGAGHSAFNVLLDLLALRAEAPDTTIVWAIRRAPAAQLFGGGAADALPERGSLGQRVRQQVALGAIQLVSSFRVERLTRTADGVIVASADQALPPVDEIVAATGFRPDLALLSELRLDLDPVVESPTALAPLIDPNVHSCGTVRPHGAFELRHPETDVYIAGMKSYGRAPTFLMLTGYEQARSIVAALRGDWASARDVQLVLPETGVCSSSAACCETPEALVASGPRRVSTLLVVQPVAGGCCEG